MGVLAGPLNGVAQTPATASGAKPTTVAPAPTPPLPPLPLDFRRLLAATPEERAKLLADRTPQDRRVLEAKLREYDALPADEREARLRALQLQLHLRPLLVLAPSKRGERLAAVPEADRPLVEERLAEWDRLPADLQKQVFESVTALRYLCRPQPPLPPLPPGVTFSVPPQRRQVEAAVARWNALPEERRLQIQSYFERFFELDTRSRSKALSRLDETERSRMQATLEKFSHLTPAQRARCVAGFQKFAELSPAERDGFLHNVERWQQMSAQDRQVWRALVTRIGSPTPPLPPAAVRPPMPPVPGPRSQPLSLATNL